MFILDDILLSPLKGLAAVSRQVEEAARGDLENQEKAAVAALSELHRCLEENKIGDEEFNAREEALLDRLEAIQDATHRHPDSGQ